MANHKPTKTSFNKDNQPTKRTPRGKAERTKILEAMKRAGQTEEGFYDLLISKAYNPEDNFSFNEVLKRLYPIPKQVAPNIEFYFNEKSKPNEKAEQIIKAVSQGQVPPDIGVMLISSIKLSIEIEETTELAERISELEKSMGLNG